MSNVRVAISVCMLYLVFLFHLCSSEIAKEAKYKNKNVIEEIMTQFCGATIITHYNKKTYRIDDIDFNLSPLSTFLKNGSEVSYFSYRN